MTAQQPRIRAERATSASAVSALGAAPVTDAFSSTAAWGAGSARTTASKCASSARAASASVRKRQPPGPCSSDRTVQPCVTFKSAARCRAGAVIVGVPTYRSTTPADESEGSRASSRAGPAASSNTARRGVQRATTPASRHCDTASTKRGSRAVKYCAP